MKYLMYANLTSEWGLNPYISFYKDEQEVDLETIQALQLLRDNALSSSLPTINEANWSNEGSTLYHCIDSDWLWFLCEYPSIVPMKGDIICNPISTHQDISIPQVEIVNRYLFGTILALEVSMNIIIKGDIEL